VLGPQLLDQVSLILKHFSVWIEHSYVCYGPTSRFLKSNLFGDMMNELLLVTLNTVEDAMKAPQSMIARTCKNTGSSSKHICVKLLPI
jgi:hypothetical protein